MREKLNRWKNNKQSKTRETTTFIKEKRQWKDKQEKNNEENNARMKY